MENLLRTAKKLLREAALEIYSCYEEDLEMDAKSYIAHYSSLGELLFQIESCSSLGDMIVKLERGVFDQIGFSGMEVVEFIEGIRSHK
jgi:hypothetical protein